MRRDLHTWRAKVALKVHAYPEKKVSRWKCAEKSVLRKNGSYLSVTHFRILTCIIKKHIDHYLLYMGLLKKCFFRWRTNHILFNDSFQFSITEVAMPYALLSINQYNYFSWYLRTKNEKIYFRKMYIFILRKRIVIWKIRRCMRIQSEIIFNFAILFTGFSNAI